MEIWIQHIFKHNLFKYFGTIIHFLFFCYYFAYKIIRITKLSEFDQTRCSEKLFFNELKDLFEIIQTFS